MKAKRKNLEIYDGNKRTFKDRRKKGAMAVFSYFTADGIEYRRTFWDDAGTPELKFWSIAPKQIEV